MPKSRAIVAAFLIILWAASVAWAAPPPLFYAVLSDTQKPDNDPLTEFRWAVGQVNEMMPDFVLMPGDLTNNGTANQYENFMRVASAMRGPVHYVIGNHEAPPGAASYRQRFTQYTARPPYYHVQTGGWHLFVLCSPRFVDGKLAHDGEIDAEQMAWLREELKAVPADAPIMLSFHHPPVFNDGLANHPELFEAFAGHYLAYTVTAHFHRNRYDQDVNAVWHLTTGSLSFSTNKASCGVGYRWISTVGTNLWTAWVETTDEKPFRPVSQVTGPGDLDEEWTAPLSEPVKGAACLQFRYQGAGPSFLLGDAGTNYAQISLPEAQEPATAFLPLSDELTRTVFDLPEARITARQSPGTRLLDFRVYETTATWQHYRLKQPGEVKATVTIHAPRDGQTVKRGIIPIAAMVEGPAGIETELLVDGKPVPWNPEGFVAAIFEASGLQSKSCGFKNHLYANGEFISALPEDRDVLTWEQMLYPIPRDVWLKEAEPWFMLTAGTPTDGTGANPPENNEDYVAMGLMLFDGEKYLRDENLPPQKSLPIGDNQPDCKTLLRCSPTVSCEPPNGQAHVHTWDTSSLAPGKHTITVKAGDTESTRTVTLAQ